MYLLLYNKLRAYLRNLSSATKENEAALFVPTDGGFESDEDQDLRTSQAKWMDFTEGAAQEQKTIV